MSRSAFEAENKKKSPSVDSKKRLENKSASPPVRAQSLSPFTPLSCVRLLSEKQRLGNVQRCALCRASRHSSSKCSDLKLKLSS